jgi:hypothetical protein
MYFSLYIYTLTRKNWSKLNLGKIQNKINKLIKKYAVKLYRLELIKNSHAVIIMKKYYLVRFVKFIRLNLNKLPRGSFLREGLTFKSILLYQY